MPKRNGKSSQIAAIALWRAHRAGKFPEYVPVSRDPTPGPYPGTGPVFYRIGESGEERAFRLHPVDSHKAGGW